MARRIDRRLVAPVIVAVCALVAPATQMAYGATTYVSPAGDDTNAGTESKPWRTLTRAVSDAQGGDTVLVRTGTYREAVDVERAGAPNAPITIAAYPGDSPVLDGGGTLGSGFTLNGDTTVDGFRIRGFRDFGVVAWTDNDRLTLKNLTIESNGGTGIRLSSSEGTQVLDVTIRNNATGGFDCTPIQSAGAGCRGLRIFRTRAISNGSGNDTAVDAFAVEKGRDIVVEDSSVDGGPGDGFDMKSDTTTLRRVSSSGVARNGIKLWGDGSRLENGLSVGSGLEGLVLTEGSPMTVQNSLVANTTRYGYTASLGEYGQPKDLSITVRNTIFSNQVRQSDDGNGTLVYIASGARVEFDSDIFFNPLREDCVIDRAGTCLESREIDRYADPRFINPVNDFHLTESSPAVDRGSSIEAPALDLDGLERPAGAAIDIGPYEYGASPASGEQPPPGTALTVSGVSFQVRCPKKKRGARSAAAGCGRSRARDLVVRFDASAAGSVVVKFSRRLSRAGGNRVVLRRTLQAKAGANRVRIPFKRRGGPFQGSVRPT